MENNCCSRLPALHPSRIELALRPLIDRWRSPFYHDRFPITETYPTFEEAEARAYEPELDRFFDLIISIGSYIASWEARE